VRVVEFQRVAVAGVIAATAGHQPHPAAVSAVASGMETTRVFARATAGVVSRPRSAARAQGGKWPGAPRSGRRAGAEPDLEARPVPDPNDALPR
jgi:hypothetical protein